MFNKFPKVRPPLPQEIEDIYAEQYKSNRDGDTAAASLAQKMESWLHRMVANDIDEYSAKGEISTLELGAGTLNQLQYETVVGSYDIVEPFSSLFTGSPLLERVRNIYGDVSEISAEARFDRVNSVATLEHICNLPEVVARCALLLNEGGVMRSSIPSEGTFLWGLGWRLTTGLEFKLRHGLDYGLLMKHEHVNTAKEIEQVLQYFFSKVNVSVFGICKPISLYQFYECSSPDLHRCKIYIESLEG